MALHLGTQTLTSLGAVRFNSLVVTTVVGDASGHREEVGVGCGWEWGLACGYRG